MNWKTGQREYLRHRPERLFEWTLVYYPVGVALAIFLILAALLLSFFLGYHIYLISQGKTQYEAYRWIDLHKFLMAQVRYLSRFEQHVCVHGSGSRASRP